MLLLSMTDLITTHTKSSARVAEQPESLGRALTALGLEDRFLSNGELKNFPLMQRAQIANEIIADKLARGRWTSVVEMIYGGFGKADALYDGDREQLKVAIVESAKKTSRPDFSGDAIHTLAEHNEDDLIFRLATALPLKFEEFNEAMKGINLAYFEDPIEGAKRKQAYHTLAAQKALKERKDSEAFHHFKTINDEAGMTAVFNSFVAGRDGGFDYYHSLGDAETFAESSSSNPKVKESRLKKLVSLACAAKNRSSSNSLHAWGIVKRHNLQLSDVEKKKLYDAVAETADAHEFLGKSVDADPELLLLWAKKHFTKDPLHAYGVFESQGYKGEEVLEAVRTALTSKDGQRRSSDEQSPVSHFSDAHLNAAYADLPFDTRTSIAFHLKDAKKFQALSKEAADKKDFRQAYDFWNYGAGDLKSDYAFKLREMMINQNLEDRDKWFNINPDDTAGHGQVYVAYMAAGTLKNQPSYFRTAYEHALQLKDEPLIRAARVKMVEDDPIWALEVFESAPRGVRNEPDQTGIDYVLGIVGKQTGVAPEKLRAYLEKYTKQEKR